MTQQEILINWSPQETRVAVVEHGAVQELHVERALERGLVGNVYLGKVQNVLPSMEAAFVDIVHAAAVDAGQRLDGGLCGKPQLSAGQHAQASFAVKCAQPLLSGWPLSR